MASRNMDLQAGSRLARMPIEIILRIARPLSTPELGNLRLTCKKLEKALFNAVSREFFHKKQFMLTDKSLQTLIDISRHPHLSMALRHIIISLDHYNTGGYSFSTEEQSSAYCIGAADQFNLLATGRAKTMLAEAFGNLPNLQTLDIRDFDSPSRFREGWDATWHSYGFTTVFNETGVILPKYSNGSEKLPSQIFSIVLGAVAQAAVQPPNIEVLIRGTHSGLSDFAFSMPAGLHESLQHVLSGLKKLHLDVRLDTARLRINNGIAMEPPAPILLKRFLLSTHNLTWLRLNFQRTNISKVKAFITWLGQTSPSEGTVAFPFLEKLDLGRLEAYAEPLLKAVTKFHTLRGLSFRNVVLQHDCGPEEQINHWQTVFKQLARSTQLHEFCVENIAQHDFHRNICEVVFQDSANGAADEVPPLLERERKYSGSCATQSLEKLAQDSLVLWIPQSESDSEDEDVEESSDSDHMNDI